MFVSQVGNVSDYSSNVEEWGFYYVMFVNNANLLNQVPRLRQLSTKDTINGLLVQSAYDVIISKILKETILFRAAVGSISNKGTIVLQEPNQNTVYL